MPPITSHAARTKLNESAWQTPSEQSLAFKKNQTVATQFTIESQVTKKPLLKNTAIAQQNVSDLPYEIVIWDMDAEPEEAIWQYEDTGDEQSLLAFFQELSIQKLSTPSSKNTTNPLSDYTELWNPNTEINDIPLTIQIADSDDYLSFIQFWHEYGKTIITTLLILTLLHLLIWPVYKEFANNRRQKIRRATGKVSRSTKLNNSTPSEFKDQASSQLLSSHGRSLKEKENTDISFSTTQSKNNGKRSHRKKNKIHVSRQSLSIHGRTLGLKNNNNQLKYRRKHRHRTHRHKPKPSLLKQFMELFFYKSDT
jgi:hypothetical protein